MKGTIFDIQRFSINDGPGIRTTVFLKGCPLDCLWCHNPESKKINSQLSYNKDKCVKCKKCMDICPNKVHEVNEEGHLINFDKCNACGKCVNVCVTSALSIYGKEVTVEDVFEVVKKDKKYYESSNGGLTISGGEPMMQARFTIELAKLAKEQGVNVAIETSGQGNEKDYKELSKYVDLYLFDYKATGKDNHKYLIGRDDKIIKGNREAILSSGSKIILRCPLVPKYNLNEDHLKEIANIAKSNEGVILVEILPYHPLGESKSINIGDEYKVNNVEMLTDKDVDNILNKLMTYGIKNVRKG